MAMTDYSGLEKGMKVQAESGGKFYAAEVIQVSTKKNGKAPVKVHFVGYEADADEWVGEDRLRSKALKKVLPQEKEAKAEKAFEPKARGGDVMTSMARACFDDAAMSKCLPNKVFKNFKDNLISGAPTSEEDQKVIAKELFKWARAQGATDFAHWFFPVRGGGGAVGGTLGAMKMDTLVDLDFKSKSANKPMQAVLPYERLFQGETDGSSFPNGGLRVTHAAAAFTVWDRSSPPFMVGTCLRIPCSFVTHLGHCIDDKTPLLRSMDAVSRQGLRLLKALGVAKDAKCLHSYLGWEQEFFVVSADLYKKRPDLVNCGRTLFGKLPPRGQQMDLNYFAPVPASVDKLLAEVQQAMLRAGTPMAVRHNEVAPGQHEMSPIFGVANFSADNNVYFMETCNRLATKYGLMVLFHEKPFAGINGSGKHANWSVGTDSGINFFYPGKTEEARTIYTAALACLSHGIFQHNELLRCAVAHAGNDHRLGAQEAPPAIISLYPGTGFEAHVDAVIKGGALSEFKAEKKKQSTGCKASMDVEANVEDRNRTAPFPFCGNRYEFRAVGSSQNCSFPVMLCNTVMAAGMSELAGKIEGGQSARDAVADMYKASRNVIFTGNGYSPEWPAEAAKRGLSNLNTTPKAIKTWAQDKNKKVFEALGIFSPEETEARAEVMYEAYNSTLSIEAKTMVDMVQTAILPSCARDLAAFKDAPALAGDRTTIYGSIKKEADKLKSLMDKVPHDMVKEAEYLCDTVKPQMHALRTLVDEAEGLLEVYPYPTYEAMLYHHHH
jgi:glutamine synthetase